jgi:hypothetical protein
VGIVVAGFDIHRAQITVDALDTDSGEVTTGRIASNPEAVVGWVGRFAGREVHVALEACTAWYVVAEALEGGGAVPHLAEVAETRALRGRKAAREDRSRRRALAEDAALVGQAAGGVDPARPHLLPAHPHPASQGAERRGDGLARAHPGDPFHVGLPSLPAGLGGERAREWLADLEPRRGRRRASTEPARLVLRSMPKHPKTNRLPAGSLRPPGSRPRAAALRRQGGRSRIPRVDPSTIMSPASPRSCTQISQGVREQPIRALHNHSPPGRLRAAAQISVV